jgi:hypothetical protein
LRQPFTKNEAVQWAEDQTLGAASRTWDHANVFGPQTVFADVGERFGAGMEVERLHGFYFLRPCSLAKALAMAEPEPAAAPAAGGEV